jgi:hypothetical protein
MGVREFNGLLFTFGAFAVYLAISAIIVFVKTLRNPPSPPPDTE